MLLVGARGDIGSRYRTERERERKREREKEREREVKGSLKLNKRKQTSKTFFLWGN